MKPNPIALLIDNDKASRRLLRTILESQRYRLFESEDGTLGLAAADLCQPDVIILELALPDIPGLSVLKRLRKSARAPVMVLSVCDREVDVVAALDGGANDFMTKPFSEPELLARLRVLRRSLGTEPESPVMTEGDLRVDLSRHLVSLSGRRIDLTPTEAALFHALLCYAGKVVSGRYLLHSVWGAEGANHGLYLRVFISQLRKKLEVTQRRVIIETAGGLGYRLLLSRPAPACGDIDFANEAIEFRKG